MRTFKLLNVSDLEKNSEKIKVVYIENIKGGGFVREVAPGFRSDFNMFYSPKRSTIVVFKTLPNCGMLIGLKAAQSDNYVKALKNLRNDKIKYNKAVPYNQVEKEMKERIKIFAENKALYYHEDWMSGMAYSDYYGVPLSRRDMSKTVTVNLKQVIPEKYDYIKINLKDTPETFTGTFLEMICTIRDDILKHFKFDILAANARHLKLKMKDSSGKEIDVPVQDFFDMFQSIHSKWSKTPSKP